MATSADDNTLRVRPASKGGRRASCSLAVTSKSKLLGDDAVPATAVRTTVVGPLVTSGSVVALSVGTRTPKLAPLPTLRVHAQPLPALTIRPGQVLGS